jgi:hypothetical protein
MSHVGHPTLSTRSQLRAHWIVAISALAALLAAAAVVLVLMIDDGGSTATSRTAAPQAAVRSDGGPNESAVAASIASRPSIPSSVPEEAARASLIAQGAGPYQPASEGPDEAATAASIAGR